jgi:cell division protein FtsZ
MAIGEATGESRATDAAQIAISSPLLDIDINGARGVLFNITGGLDLTLYEVNEAADIISKAAHPEANIIFGAVQDPAYDGRVKITVIATGFDARSGQVVGAQAGRIEYNRGMFYPGGGSPVGSGGRDKSSSYNGSNYSPLPVTPPPLNIARHPTGPLQNAGRAMQSSPPAQNQLSSTARQPLASLGRGDIGHLDVDDLYDADEDTGDRMEVSSQTAHSHLPVPEPEAQPSQRPAADARQQRPVRRMDPKALDLPRGNRNAPQGDVIDIPAFLRKR